MKLPLTRIGLFTGILALTVVVAFIESGFRSNLARSICAHERDHCKIELSLLGIQFSPFYRSNGTGHWAADTLNVSLNWNGISVVLHGLQQDHHAFADASSNAQSARDSESTTSRKDPSAPQQQTGQFRNNVSKQFFQRIANFSSSIAKLQIRIEIDGQIPVFNRDGIKIGFNKIQLQRDLKGQLKTNMVGEVTLVDQAPFAFSGSIGPIPLDLEFESLPEIAISIQSQDSRLQLQFVAMFDAIDNELNGTIHSEDGKAEIQLRFPENNSSIKPTQFSLIAKQFGGRLLDPLQTKISQFGLNIDLSRAKIDGQLRIDRSQKSQKVSADELTVSQFAIRNRYLADQAIEIDVAKFNGYFSTQPNGFRAKGSLQHREANLKIDAKRLADEVSLKISLAKIACQSLFRSIPTEFVPTLTGLEFEGEVSGNLELDFMLSELEQIRENPLAQDPGQLKFDLPILEQCKVIQEPSAIDFKALKRVYRHRFLSATGVEQVRLLGVENSDYVRRSTVPNLTLAFVILEDAQFWKHDGFDRDQMVRAFWHNLARSRFSRGASTITQQTARNLWLGASRSLSRKVQEAMLTTRLEHYVSKSKIAELYLNLIELGPEIHGVASASQFHFGVDPDKLTVIQALHLASMAPAPVAYSKKWVSGKVDEEWMKMLRSQLRRMLARGLLSRKEFQTEARRSLNLLDRTR